MFRLHTKGIFKKPKRVNWDRDCFLFKQAFGSLTATIQLLFKTKWKIYKDRLRVCTENVPSDTGRKHKIWQFHIVREKSPLLKLRRELGNVIAV